MFAPSIIPPSHPSLPPLPLWRSLTFAHFCLTSRALHTSSLYRLSCDHTDDVVNKRLKHREAVVGNTPSLNRLAKRFVTFVTTVQDSEASSTQW